VRPLKTGSNNYRTAVKNSTYISPIFNILKPY